MLNIVNRVQYLLNPEHPFKYDQQLTFYLKHYKSSTKASKSGHYKKSMRVCEDDRARAEHQWRMKGLLCTLLLLETFVFVVQQQVDGGLAENEISQQLSTEDRRQNPAQTDPRRDETDSQQYCHLSFPDIHAALRELTATVTEQKANIRALETRLKEQQMFILEELNKKNDGTSLKPSLFYQWSSE